MYKKGFFAILGSCRLSGLPKTNQEAVKYIEAIGEVWNNSKSYQLENHFYGENEAEDEVTDLNKSDDKFYDINYIFHQYFLYFTLSTHQVDHGVLYPM